MDVSEPRGEPQLERRQLLDQAEVPELAGRSRIVAGTTLSALLYAYALWHAGPPSG